MISAWWLIPALFVGVAIGIVLISICAANTATEQKRKWWEDEQCKTS